MDQSQSILFSEKQRFTQWWIWLIVLGINGMFVYALITQVFYGMQFGDNPMSDTGLWIANGLSILFTVFMLSLRLETTIKEDGIYLRFYPFHLKTKFISWQEITKAYVREYSPLFEFGGWGIRYTFDGKAYNVYGKIGLQLEYGKGKKLLVGTRKGEELKALLDELGIPKE